jgi:hypothetical protein
MPVRACVDQVVRSRFLDQLSVATIRAANSLPGTIGTFRWQFSHIRQPAQEEGWLAAEIGTNRSWRVVRLESAFGAIAEVIFQGCEVCF